MAPQTTCARRLKSVMFCQECGHESPIDGDWNRSRVDGRSRYSCPECGHAVAERPAGTAASRSGRSAE